jgi:hypothetical protein
MHSRKHKTVVVTATVHQVLPMVGLAYLSGDDHREWAVTKSTQGVGLEGLHPGERVSLTVEHHDKFEIVRAYSRAD